MDEQHQKSIHRKAEAIFKKAEDREKTGGDYFETGWQATLELMLLMMEQQILENPGQLLPMQTSGDDEWDFYLDVMEKLDLPPDTGAVLITPSAFKEMKIDAVFKLIETTVPKEYETLDRTIEITNDLSRDMDLGEPTVTKAGIMADDEAQCQALLNRITVEINMTLDMLSYQKDVKVPGRNIQNLQYNQVFDDAARRIYEVITGRVCPELVRVR